MNFGQALAARALPALVGGFLRNRREKKARRQQMTADNLLAVVRRQWDHEDRTHAERRADSLRADDRAYQRRWRDEERAHAASWRASERAYSERRRDEDRAHDDWVRRGERQYSEVRRDEQRSYDEGWLGRLREQAKEAGFNPLTVLGTTGGAPQSGAMQPPSFSASASGVPSFPAPGMAASVGGGEVPWTGSGNYIPAAPALSSRSFIAEAFEDGVDTFFNYDQMARDEEADALRIDLMRAELEAIQREDSEPFRRFGYSIPQSVSTASSGAVEDFSTPELAERTDDPQTEMILGVRMPAGAHQRNEDAGGDVMGNVQTFGEWGFHGKLQLDDFLQPKLRNLGKKIYKFGEDFFSPHAPELRGTFDPWRGYAD